jgi:hypothetical protein
VSLSADGHHYCDRCGVDVGNGGIFAAAFISDLNPDRPGEPQQLHLCREQRGDAPRGCAGVVRDEISSYAKTADHSGL